MKCIHFGSRIYRQQSNTCLKNLLEPCRTLNVVLEARILPHQRKMGHLCKVREILAHIPHVKSCMTFFYYFCGWFWHNPRLKSCMTFLRVCVDTCNCVDDLDLPVNILGMPVVENKDVLISGFYVHLLRLVECSAFQLNTWDWVHTWS